MSIGGLKITKRDLDTLNLFIWLNDTLILGYLKYITEANHLDRIYSVFDPLYFTKIKQCGIPLAYNSLKNHKKLLILHCFLFATITIGVLLYLLRRQ